MNTLQLGKTSAGKPFVLPLEIVTEKLAFLGRTGSGKTYSATKLAELMLAAGAQIVAIDPVGVWRGLRMGGGDFQIYIFGGLSGDFPLESTGGALVADLIVDRGISAVLDVSQFGTDTELRRFVYDFATRFFHRKKSHVSAVHVFMEECQEMIPQDKQHGDERMLHAMQRMWKLGRGFGIGGSLISQRPQDVNKKALNMSGTLFVHQMTAPGDRKVISAWVDEKGIEADVGALLPKIEVGKPHVWSPDFLKVSEAIHVSAKITEDISATPKVGASAKAQKLSPIDVEKIGKEMVATIERAKADDPRELKTTISNLQREIANLTSAARIKEQFAATAKPEVVRVEVPVMEPHIVDAIRTSLEAVEGGLATLQETLRAIVTRVEKFAIGGGATPSGAPNRSDKVQAPRELGSARPDMRARPPTAPDGTLDGAQQKIIDVVAMLGVRGIPAYRECVARWLDIHPNGGRYGTNLAHLRVSGYLDGFNLTPKGAEAAWSIPTGFAGALEPLDGSQREIMEMLKNLAPYTRESLAAALNIHPNGGRYGTNLARLRTMGLIPERGDILLTDAVWR